MLAHPAVRKDPRWREFHSLYLEIRAKFVEFEVSIEHADEWIQRIAGVAAALNIVALVYSAYRPGETLGHGWVSVLLVLTVLPSCVAIIFNTRFVRKKLDAITRGRRKADVQLIELYKLMT
jgi:hypothetical protein